MPGVSHLYPEVYIFNLQLEIEKKNKLKSQGMKSQRLYIVKSQKIFKH